MPPLIVVVGETGSGKTALAIELAQRFDGEIIAADSRTVYTGMDIGTAKPTAEERQGVPHFGLDVVEPGQHFSAYEFKQLAQTAIENISSRGKLPIMVGGTGLYVDAVLYDFAFRPQPEVKKRQELQGLSIEELQSRILAAHLPLPDNSQNPRHLTRVLESGTAPQQNKKLRANTLVLGITLPRDQLEARIKARVEAMVAAGLINEVRVLAARYGDAEAFRTPGYKAFLEYVRGNTTLAEAKRQFARDDLRLAKRQRTWFKRSSDIHWLTGQDKAVEAMNLVAQFLK